MGLRGWSNRLDRRAHEQWRRPYVAPLYLFAALAMLLYGVLVARSPVVPLIFAAGWFVLSVVSIVARSRDRW